MPLYEYHCDHCEEDFEKMVRFSEADQLPECPHCHSSETRKRISAVASRGFGSLSAGDASSSSCGSSSGRFT